MLAYSFKSSHNPKVRGSNPLPATIKFKGLGVSSKPFFVEIPVVF
jgi:hypothetical protein